MSTKHPPGKPPTPPPGAAEPPIFSYPLAVAEIPASGLDLAIAADAATLQALAKANGLPAIARLEAEFHLAPKAGQRINVSGELRATVTQICVVSLEPFDSEVVEPIDVDFVPPELVAADTAMAVLEGEEEALAADPIIDGKIDLGALAAEFLALGLDPYPRKPGVVFEPPQSEEQAAGDKPFSVLGRLKERS